MSKRSTHVNAKVEQKKDEPFERMLRRFIKKVKKERVVEQVKKKINSQNDNNYNKKRG